MLHCPFNLKELPGCDVSDTRDAWLYFCSANGTPVSESNLVMMTITTTIYRVLLECVMSFQESLTATNTDTTSGVATLGPTGALALPSASMAPPSRS